MLDSLQSAEFVRLWTLYGQRIYAYLVTLSSNYVDADEIYQEVGMTLWQKFDQYTPGTNFHAWARQVALYKVRNFRLLRRHNTMLCSPELLDVIDQTVKRTINTLDSQNSVFVDCFNKLSPRIRF